MLHGSLNVTQGCPVSNNIDNILRHKTTASICFDKILPSAASFRTSCTFREMLVKSIMQVRYLIRRKQCPCSLFITRSVTNQPSCSIHIMGASTIVTVFLRNSKKSMISKCHVSKYAHTAPLRLPPWLTAIAVASTFKNAIPPEDKPLVPLFTCWHVLASSHYRDRQQTSTAAHCHVYLSIYHLDYLALSINNNWITVSESYPH